MQAVAIAIHELCIEVGSRVPAAKLLAKAWRAVSKLEMVSC